MGDVYSLVMIDIPLIYEDTVFPGDMKAIQCCVSCCAKEGRGLCQAQGLEHWGVSLGAFVLISISPQQPTLTGNVRRREGGGGNYPSSSLAPVQQCLLYFCLCPAAHLAIL